MPNQDQIKIAEMERQLSYLREALRIAYRDITGDYSDGGTPLDKRAVIAVIVSALNPKEPKH